jgi:hypothetical protein
MPAVFRILVAAQLVAAVSLATDPFYLAGTVTNTTNENQQQTAGAVFSFDQGDSCTLVIGPPLYGSGGCSVTTFEIESGKLELVSFGPLTTIKWTGIMKDGKAAGTYIVEQRGVPTLPEVGTFSLLYQEKLEKPPKLADFLGSEVVKTGDAEFVLWLERDILSIHHKDGAYAGRRVVLDTNKRPLVIIEDGANGSIYRLPDSKEPLLEWVTDGKTGYYAQPNGKTKRYLDRFFQPTGWESFESGSKTVFARQNSDGIELFDNSLKPLGLRSGKTSAGRVYWMATKDSVAEYLDESLKSLNWYSLQRDGQTYFARLDGKKKVKLYDANLNELRPPKKEGFWTQFARGLAVGMAAYGQALQEQQAQQQAAAQNSYGYAGTSAYQGYQPYRRSPSISPPISYDQTTTSISPSSSLGFSNTYTSTGQSYTTTTQRLGSFMYSNTTGSNGYYASSTTQRLGAFDYTSGFSSNGAFSGTSQRLGNFDYSNYTMPSGMWNGTSQQLGNFTFHNFNGPNGQMLSGTSQRIGNFIYTNIH